MARMAWPLRVEYPGAIYHVAARMLCRYSDLTQREVAEVLKMGSGSGVSHQLRKLGELEKTDGRLRRQMGKMESELTETREKGIGRDL